MTENVVIFSLYFECICFFLNFELPRHFFLFVLLCQIFEFLRQNWPKSATYIFNVKIRVFDEFKTSSLRSHCRNQNLVKLA